SNASRSAERQGPIDTAVFLGLIAAALGAITATMTVSWLVHRHDVEGLGWWLVACAGMATGLGLAAGGGHLPEPLSVEIANSLYLGGHAAMVRGHSLFTGCRINPWWLVAPLLVVAPPFLYFHLVEP